MAIRFACPVLAQSDAKMREVYVQAENDYRIGRVEEAREALLQNLTAFQGNLRQNALRLIALISLDEYDVRQAEQYTARLLELNRLYSTGQFEQAHALENDLRGMAANLPQPASQGTRYDLQRYVEQAKVLSFRNLNINPALMQSRALPEDTGMQIPDTLTSM